MTDKPLDVRATNPRYKGMTPGQAARALMRPRTRPTRRKG